LPSDFDLRDFAFLFAKVEFLQLSIDVGHLLQEVDRVVTIVVLVVALAFGSSQILFDLGNNLLAYLLDQSVELLLGFFLHVIRLAIPSFVFVERWLLAVSSLLRSLQLLEDLAFASVVCVHLMIITPLFAVLLFAVGLLLLLAIFGVLVLLNEIPGKVFGRLQTFAKIHKIPDITASEWIEIHSIHLLNPRLG
jgi:hypothetical protein